MKKVIIWGASGSGQKLYNLLKTEVQVIGFIDSDERKWGTSCNNVRIYPPIDISHLAFDEIYIGTLPGYHEVLNELEKMGIPYSKINRSNEITAQITISIESRINFIKRFSEEISKQTIISGAVAEAGVYRGEFAKQINKYFPNNNLYLFDTFEGFSEADIKLEQKESQAVEGHYANTSEEIVLGKMSNPDRVIIRKGYFPETTKLGVSDSSFIFVNLDMDLYQPTLDGLRYFYPKMIEGGVILIHDFYSLTFPNVEQAVLDFQKETNFIVKKMPIGDDCSIAIIK